MPLSRETYFNLYDDYKKIADEINVTNLSDTLNLLSKGKYTLEIIKLDYYEDGYPAGYKTLKQIKMEVI